jgi:hypothetical protein
MTLSMSQASIPVFQRGLKACAGLLDKAAAHCEANKIDPAVLLQFRLYPDMLNFTRQVQQVTEHSAGAAARLAGAEPWKVENSETSFDALKARVARALDVVTAIDPAKVDGTEAKDLVVTLGPRSVDFKGQAYLFGHALPNFYFHLTTAHCILRHNGVVVGKRDFMGPA